MKISSLAVGFISTLLLGAAAPACFADSHDHHHHDAPPARLELNDGKRWPTDDPLRKNMETMRTALAERLPEIHAGKLSREEYAALGKNIEGRIGDIVAQCKLDPKADAMLHLVVADLVSAADVMQGKGPGKPSAAAHAAAGALNAYGKYFNHPGWKELK